MATHAPSQLDRVQINLDPRLFSTSTLLGRSTMLAAQPPAPRTTARDEAEKRARAAQRRRFQNLAMGLAAVAYAITYLTLLAVTRPSATEDQAPIAIDIPAAAVRTGPLLAAAPEAQIAAEPIAIAARPEPVRRPTPTLKKQPATARPSR